MEYKDYDTAFDILDNYLDQQLKIANREQEHYNILIPFTQIEQLLVKAEMNTEEIDYREQILGVKIKVHNILDIYAKFTKAASLFQ